MKTPLFPKLRGHFAEFLNESSLERLSILCPSTCVGLRYVHLPDSLQRFFLAAWCGPVLPFRRLGSSRSLSPACAEYYERNPGYPKPGRLNLLRHSALITPNRWCGNILPHCPSLTPFGLSLGTTNPGRINLPQETLDFRRARFTRAFSLLIPA